MAGETAGNMLFILSDEHASRALSCAGHPALRTPALDALAARGVRFTNAITPSPICVPARAALATGQRLSRMGRHFDNADPYDGATPSWHHALRGAGHRVVSIGKLHFRGLVGDDHGFSEEKRPMHVVDGKGDLLALIRDASAPARKGASKMAATAGPGESDYTRYDRDIAADAQVWLHEEAGRQQKPWCLFVSLVTPHFPLIAPPEHFYAYPPHRLAMPKAYAPAERPAHPFLRDYAETIPYDASVRGEADVKRMLAGYFGLVSFMDEQVGKILGALDCSGNAASTRVLYASDHGDNAGARGLWGKSTMYEESVGVPMILAGPGLPQGTTVDTPASLIDVFPTLTEALGLNLAAPDPEARSLFALAAGDDTDRAVTAEYHAAGSREAAFLLRTRRWSYVRYVSYPAQLFDRAEDPEELRDRARDPDFAGIVAELEARLVASLGAEPAAIDRAVKARQAGILAANGGREAVLARGDLPYSPPPGVRPNWS